MTNNIKTIVNAKNLFEVQGLAKQHQSSVYDQVTKRWVTPPAKYLPETRIMTAETIELNRKYDNDWFQMIDAMPLGIVWPDGVVVEQTFYSYKNCYAHATYVVYSPKELSERDFEILRIQGCFMSGQETGKLVRTVKTDRGYEYFCQSICDSSD